MGFFAESHQAEMHQCDVILHAVIKIRTWATAGRGLMLRPIVCAYYGSYGSKSFNYLQSSLFTSNS